MLDLGGGAAVARRDPNLWEWTGKRFKYTGGTSLGGRRDIVYVSPRLVVSFAMNRAGIARIAVAQPMRETVHLVVSQKAMPYAISISPRGSTLEYVSSWQTVDTYTVIAGMRRAAARLRNNSTHAAAVEWVSRRGSGHGYHVLGRTLAYLASTSPAGIAAAAKKAARAARKTPAKLPARGAGGRFVSSNSAATLKRRARNARRITE